jgi:hypothetical protein
MSQNASVSETPSPAADVPDTGILALVLTARILGLAADPEQLRHQLGGERMNVTELLRTAR